MDFGIQFFDYDCVILLLFLDLAGFVFIVFAGRVYFISFLWFRLIFNQDWRVYWEFVGWLVIIVFFLKIIVLDIFLRRFFFWLRSVVSVFRGLSGRDFYFFLESNIFLLFLVIGCRFGFLESEQYWFRIIIAYDRQDRMMFEVGQF